MKIWVVGGLLGLAAFLVLRQQVSFQTRIDHMASRSEIEQRTSQIAVQLGFSLDSLAVMYQQNYEIPKEKFNTPSQLPPEVRGWQVVVGRPLNDWLSLSKDPSQLYQQQGYVKLTFTRRGDLMSLQTNPDLPNPTFVAHDSLLSAVRYLINTPFRYDGNDFELQKVNAFSPQQSDDSDDSLATTFTPENDARNTEGTAFQWVSKRDSTLQNRAHRLNLEVVPKFRQITDSLRSRFQYGVAVNSFKAEFRNDSPNSNPPVSSSNLSALINIGALIVILGFLLFVGFRQIFRGQVDWMRALKVMMFIGIVYFIGRTIYLMDLFGTFLTGGAEAVLLVGQLIGSVAFGLFAALAYIGWEALARDQKHPQVELVDAYWRKRFFYRETGQAIITGIAVGGLLSGVYAGYLALNELWYFQDQGMFYNTLTNSNYPWLTLALTLLINVLVVGLVGFGVIRSYIKEVLSPRYLNAPFSIVLIGAIMLSPGLISTSGSIWHEFILLILLVGILLYVYEKEGIVTLFWTWLFFTSTVTTSLLWTGNSLPISITCWGFAGFFGLAFLYGLTAQRYGKSVKELDGYVPEYEERLAHQMRVEKEIEIARESQFKLMPVKAPQVEGVDIYGFFMPSFEVGGDYFEYVPVECDSSEPQAIAFAIADVSGKAMKAAMQAVFTSGLLLSRLHKDNPARILQEISPTIYSRTDPKTFITCLLGQYHIKEQRLTFANAGHCRPILKRNGKAQFVYTEDPKFPLGVRPQVEYREKYISMNSGDFLLFYSDGMPEATDNKGNQFGYDALLGLVESVNTDDMTAKQIAQELKRRIQKFSDYQLADDTTLICLKI